MTLILQSENFWSFKVNFTSSPSCKRSFSVIGPIVHTNWRESSEFPQEPRIPIKSPLISKVYKVPPYPPNHSDVFFVVSNWIPSIRAPALIWIFLNSSPFVNLKVFFDPLPPWSEPLISPSKTIQKNFLKKNCCFYLLGCMLLM